MLSYSNACFVLSFLILTSVLPALAEEWKQPWISVFNSCSNYPAEDRVDCYGAQTSRLGNVDGAVARCMQERIGQTSCGANTYDSVNLGREHGIDNPDAERCLATQTQCANAFGVMTRFHQEALARGSRETIDGGIATSPRPRSRSRCSDEEIALSLCPQGDHTDGMPEEGSATVAGGGSEARRAEDARDRERAAAAADGDGGGAGSRGGGEREGSAGGDPASTGQGSYASPERTAACTAAKSDAIQCCNNPLGCMIGGANSGVGTAVQSGVGMVGQIGGMVAGSGQMGSKQMCDFMKIAGSATAGINMAGAAVCQQKKSVCNRACDGVEAGACDMLNINIAAQANQAIQSAYAAKMGQECAQLTDANNGLKPADFDPKSDCSDPANSTNPYCQDCSGPNAKNNPFCRTPSKGTGSSSGFASGNGGADFGSNGDGGYDSNPDLGDAISQQQDLGMGADTRSEANPIGGGGGGMAGGGAGGASLGDGNPGAGTGGGYNTAVLKGVGGGGGYTAPTTSRVAVSSGGGGFSGYGSGGAKDPGLDLRQFLPGAQNDPRKGRSVAGLAQAADAQIGRKETNIFQTMSVKYKQMCQLQRMWDCPKLSQKTGGF